MRCYLLERTVAALSLAALLLAAPRALGQTSDAPKVAAAQALFEQASAALDRKDYASACPKLEEVVRLVPEGIGGHLALGECYEGSGRLTSAWTAYSRAEGLALQGNQPARQKEAHRHVEALKPRLAQLTIEVPEAVRALPSLRVERDGIQVGQAQWGLSLPVDKGKHVVTAAAEGKPRFEETVEIPRDGERATVTIAWSTSAPPADKGTPPSEGEPTPPSGAEPRSHHMQPGVMLRVDVDPIHRGAVFVPGLTLGLGGHVEIGASVLLGRDKGFEPAVTALVLEGAVKPLVNVGLPIFFRDGAHPGLRGAGGVQWDPNRHFGVFAQIGVAYFFTLPPGYTSLVFLPSAGVQGRL